MFNSGVGGWTGNNSTLPSHFYFSLRSLSKKELTDQGLGPWWAIHLVFKCSLCKLHQRKKAFSHTKRRPSWWQVLWHVIHFFFEKLWISVTTREWFSNLATSLLLFPSWSSSALLLQQLLKPRLSETTPSSQGPAGFTFLSGYLQILLKFAPVASTLSCNHERL